MAARRLAGVDVVVHPVPDRLPALRELLRDAAELIEGVDAWSSPTARDEVDLCIWGCVAKHRIEVPPIQCGNGSASELNVLLRHRPRSIPRQRLLRDQ